MRLRSWFVLGTTFNLICHAGLVLAAENTDAVAEITVTADRPIPDSCQDLAKNYYKASGDSNSDATGNRQWFLSRIKRDLEKDGFNRSCMQIIMKKALSEESKYWDHIASKLSCPNGQREEQCKAVALSQNWIKIVSATTPSTQVAGDSNCPRNAAPAEGSAVHNVVNDGMRVVATVAENKDGMALNSISASKMTKEQIQQVDTAVEYGNRVREIRNVGADKNTADPCKKLQSVWASAKKEFSPAHCKLEMCKGNSDQLDTEYVTKWQGLSCGGGAPAAPAAAKTPTAQGSPGPTDEELAENSQKAFDVDVKTLRDAKNCDDLGTIATRAMHDITDKCRTEKCLGYYTAFSIELGIKSGPAALKCYQ